MKTKVPDFRDNSKALSLLAAHVIPENRVEFKWNWIRGRSVSACVACSTGTSEVRWKIPAGNPRETTRRVDVVDRDGWRAVARISMEIHWALVSAVTSRWISKELTVKFLVKMYYYRSTGWIWKKVKASDPITLSAIQNDSSWSYVDTGNCMLRKRCFAYFFFKIFVQFWGNRM